MQTKYCTHCGDKLVKREKTWYKSWDRKRLHVKCENDFIRKMKTEASNFDYNRNYEKYDPYTGEQVN